MLKNIFAVIGIITVVAIAAPFITLIEGWVLDRTVCCSTHK